MCKEHEPMKQLMIFYRRRLTLHLYVPSQPFSSHSSSVSHLCTPESGSTPIEISSKELTIHVDTFYNFKGAPN